MEKEKVWKKKWKKGLITSLLLFTTVLVGCSATDVEDEVIEGDIATEEVVTDSDVVEVSDSDNEREDAPAENPEVVDEASNTSQSSSTKTTAPTEVVQTSDVIVINDNIPYFSNEDITQTEAYHLSGELDEYKRVTAANALVGVELMPGSGNRGDISGVSPTGWNQARYANIGSGGWLYNRSHLIGHQMTGNDSPRNLMTGTRWFNEQMIPYENTVANYVEQTENHVRYRVTPVFEGSNMVASGAYMEALSIEDNGEGVMFNIYIPNIQPGVEINYADGSSRGQEGPVPAEEADPITPYTPPADTSSSSGSSGNGTQYVDENGKGLIKGSNSGIYHIPGSSYYDRTTNPKAMFKSIEEAESAGYRAPK